MQTTPLRVVLASILLAAAAPAGAARLEGVDVSPKTVTAGDSVVVTIVLDRPGAQPTLRTLGETQALHIPAQPIAMFDRATWTKQYTTSHFTDQTRSVQIRADWGGRSRVVHLTVLPAGAPAPSVSRPTVQREYVFDSPQEVERLVRHARRNGFRFRASVLPGHLGRCDLSLTRVTPVVPPLQLFVAPPPCHATFFQGRRLASGWSLARAAFEGGPGVYDRQHSITWRWIKSPDQQHGPGDSSLAIVAEEAMPSDYVELVEVVLVGPGGRDWRQAFDRSRR